MFRFIFTFAIAFGFISPYAQELKDCRFIEKSYLIKLDQDFQSGFRNTTKNYSLEQDQRALDITAKLNSATLKFIDKISFKSKPWMKIDKLDQNVKAVECFERVVVRQWLEKERKYIRTVLELVDVEPKFYYDATNNNTSGKREIQKVGFQCRYESPYTQRGFDMGLKQNRLECSANLVK